MFRFDARFSKIKPDKAHGMGRFTPINDGGIWGWLKINFSD